jgi:tRNA(fMet)-specific endonuclease VapC
MMFLLDTNAFSDLMRKHSKLDARMCSLAPVDRVVICPVVRGEIRYGIEQLPQSRRRQDLERQSMPLFAVIPCEPIPEAAGDHYARTKLIRQQKGLVLDENDLWIAATALALGAVLITRDSDFQQVEGLSVNDWTL